MWAGLCMTPEVREDMASEVPGNPCWAVARKGLGKTGHSGPRREGWEEVHGAPLEVVAAGDRRQGFLGEGRRGCRAGVGASAHVGVSCSETEPPRRRHPSIKEHIRPQALFSKTILP